MTWILLFGLQFGDADSAVLENRYKDAVSSLREAAKDAARNRDHFRLEEISRKLKEVLTLEKEYRKVRRHDGKGDPASCRIMGRFECFVKGAWERGLPLLEKSDDPFLSGLAKKELEGGDPVSIADSWWTGFTEINMKGSLTGASGTSKERIDRKTFLFWKSKLRDRALLFYRKAWPSLPLAERPQVRSRALGEVGALDKGALTGSEANLKGWHPVSSYWGASLVSPGRSGRRSAFFVPAPEKNDTGFSAVQSLQGRAIEGAKYKASVFILSSETDTSGIVEIRFFDDGGSPIKGFTSGFPPDFPFWKEVTVECEAPKGSASVAIDIRAKISQGWILVDDASLEGPEGEILRNGSFEK